MGKFKKAKIRVSNRNSPLEKQILESQYAKPSTRVKERPVREEDEEFVTDKLSKKILKEAIKQQEDLQEEIGSIKGTSGKSMKGLHGPLLGEDSGESDEEEEAAATEKLRFSIEEFEKEIQVDEEDAKALEVFMSADPSERVSLAEIIKERITEKETEIQSQFSDAGSVVDERLEKLKPLYQGVGQVLSRYRSGKLPKAFKTLPMLSRWEELLYITEPDKWTAAAMYQATRIFASNLKEKMAQRFYNLVLLPRLRDDIEESKMLNFHLYQALKKALFKPGAFFKGIVLPLCQSGNCTLREATIIGSVLAKCSVPVLHSSAAIMKIAEMDYSGANSIFLRILIEKKYALPFRAIDAVVAHFLRFALDKRELPLLWHQCFLTFAQIYKNDISTEQRDALLNLLTVHRHQHISPEIRKELNSAVPRTDEVKEPMQTECVAVQ